MLHVEIQYQTRKRIWEVDCLSMDTAIAAAFDWQDLVNLIVSSGYAFQTDKPAAVLEMEAQSVIHHHCHSENDLALKVETLLNQWFENWIVRSAGLPPQELMQTILNSDFNRRKEMAGMAWALGTDARSEMSCMRRKLHQRFQVVTLRRLA